MRKKVALYDFAEFMYSFNASPERKQLRLGQAFLNKFYPEVIDTELFYMTDDITATEIILKKYVINN